MKQVDLICDPEVLPRVRLLKKHMRLLEINLRIRYAATDKLTDPFIVIPGKQDSVPTPAGLRCAALYLDNRRVPQPADFVVHIPNWPARSSDHNVSELAKYLHRPALARSGAGSAPDAAPAGSNSRLGALLGGWRERAPAVVLLIAVVGLFSLIDFSDDTPPEGRQADNGPPTTAPATAPETSFITTPTGTDTDIDTNTNTGTGTGTDTDTDTDSEREPGVLATAASRPLSSDLHGQPLESGGVVDTPGPMLSAADEAWRYRQCAPALLLSRDYPQTCFRCDTWYRRWLEPR